MGSADHNSRLDAEQLKARWLAAAFVLYGLIANGLLAINVHGPNRPGAMSAIWSLPGAKRT
jgi:hypothetical protein